MAVSGSHVGTSDKGGRLGGNKVVSFYSVTLPKPQPRYFTLSVIEASAKPPTFVVLDASP